MIYVAFTRITSVLSSITVSKRGAVATEMSLILPLLTSMLMGVFEFGTVVYSYSAMQFGANRVARTVAVNRMTNAQAQTAVKNYISPWARNAVTVSVTQTNPTDTSINLITVRLSISADDATPLPLLTRLAPWNLTSTVVMKQELPYVD